MLVSERGFICLAMICIFALSQLILLCDYKLQGMFLDKGLNLSCFSVLLPEYSLTAITVVCLFM